MDYVLRSPKSVILHDSKNFPMPFFSKRFQNRFSLFSDLFAYFMRYVQRFQLAVHEVKVKLDLTISPGTWLMPSRMVINTESTVGYTNKLKRVSPSMPLGVNSDVNADGTLEVGIRQQSWGEQS